MSAAGLRSGGDPGGKVVRRADGWPHERYAIVERAWAGDCVVILGGGPSLTRGQVARTQARRDREGRRVRVIAINNAYQLAPWADVLYFADAEWWEWHREREEFKRFAGQKVTIYPTGIRVGDPDVFTLRNAGSGDSGPALSDDPAALVTGRNSGYQAMNLAVLAGAKRIVLLGYDMKQGEKGNNWHDEHRRQTPRSHYDMFRRALDKAAPAFAALGVEVLNATPGSALKAYPRVELESVLPDPEGPGLSA